MNKFVRFGSTAGLVLILASCQAASVPVTQTILTATVQASAAPSGSTVPIATPQPTFVPSTSASPIAASAPSSTLAHGQLRYLWPSVLPQQMLLNGVEASASADMFVISAAAPGTQWSATITGGPTSRAIQLPPSGGTQPVSVRGEAGAAFSTGAGYSLFWEEEGTHYAVLSTLSLDDALTLANGLQPLEQAAWLAQLDQVR